MNCCPADKPSEGQNFVQQHFIHDYLVMMMSQADGDADSNVADADDAFTVDDDVFSPETPFNHRKRYWTVKRY